MTNYFDNEIEEYLNTVCRIRGYSDNTIASYREDFIHLKSFITSLDKDIYSITKEDAEFFILKLMDDNLSNRSINRILSACRGFYKIAYRNKKISYNPFSDIKNTKNVSKLPTFLTTNEANNLINAIDNGTEEFLNLRNLAILVLLYSTGERRAEVQSLNADDIDFDNSQIIVKGKGDKYRITFITKDAEVVLKQYLKERNKIANDKALFINKNGKRLTLSSYNKIFSHLEKSFNSQKHITPHTIRHTFATELMNNGMDIRTLQELLGHSSTSTTGIYMHLSLKNLIEIYSHTHPHA